MRIGGGTIAVLSDKVFHEISRLVQSLGGIRHQFRYIQPTVYEKP